MVQWLRICLPIQGTWVQSPVLKDPTCHRAIKPESHNCRSPSALEPVPHNRRSHLNEKPKYHNERVAPTAREPAHSNEDPAQSKRKR